MSSEKELSTEVDNVLQGEYIESRYTGLYEKIMKGRVCAPMEDSWYIRNIKKWIESIK